MGASREWVSDTQRRQQMTETQYTHAHAPQLDNETRSVAHEAPRPERTCLKSLDELLGARNCGERRSFVLISSIVNGALEWRLGGVGVTAWRLALDLGVGHARARAHTI